MVQICIMSGHEGHLGTDKRVYLTLMGGCELTCPTMARQISQRQQRERNKQPGPRQVLILTVMGATEIKAPTLAQEYLDFSEFVGNGVITMADWDRSLAEAGRTDLEIASFTLMGGFSECELPSDEEEADALALHQHLGNIPPSVVEILKYGVGQRGTDRRATLRRAVAEAVQPQRSPVPA